MKAVSAQDTTDVNRPFGHNHADANLNFRPFQQGITSKYDYTFCRYK